MATVSLVQRLRSSTFVLVLLGAGISAPSDIPTFAELREWRGYPCQWLNSAAAFEQQPVLVWFFFETLRQIMCRAEPNDAHRSLTELAGMKPHLLTISQNIDDLCERAGHLPPQLVPIHGSIFMMTCSRPGCTYTSRSPSLEPAVPSLVLPTYDISNSKTPLPTLEISELPHCPACRTHLLRRGVVRYRELLPAGSLDAIDRWFGAVPRVDLMLVIGTSAELSSQFIDDARLRGASIAHFNLQYQDQIVEDEDLFIQGDVSTTLRPEHD
ncbi:hypothetical protein M409DRAFT_71687 [Zasmidium cellare ATCC 36951]|uniref:Deacetylase sirtuin-type domain-containing protein n=1 Tax=Zasmidium cellare ATCC 36951 TaxID=1080233 RepID=A0A6A6BY67_ZASCE|nr:uncharacterized protein M409DRAFT_71687 [Zasmidium cellare ATCC 36951]KAF2158346.1 hypothetical protein M409DRAFT_71687 [Zasmidium cellare ATCC 36951]